MIEELKVKELRVEELMSAACKGLTVSPEKDLGANGFTSGLLSSRKSMTSETKWPWSHFCGTPYWVSSLVSFHLMRDLSLDAERIISGKLGFS